MKIQINNLAALERLIGGDTELEIEIRNNIVQEFTKRHLKGLVETETIKQAITDTKLMVVNYAKKEVAEQIGEIKRSYGSTTYNLQDDVVEAIKDQISKAMNRVVYDHIENLVKTYVGNLNIKKYINQMIDFNIKQTVEEGIRERFEAMLKKTSK